LGDFEILAVDDGSKDASPDILIEFSRQDSRLRMINIEHGGIVAGLKAGFGHSEARYLARMDADDISLPSRLEKQVALLDERNDVAVVGCQVGPVTGQTLGGGYIEYFRWINGLIEPEDIARNIFVESPMPHPTVVFRRGPYSQVGGYKDHRWPEDYDLWLRMHLAGFKFAKVPEVLVQWRDHPDRTSRCNPRYDVEAFFQAKAKYLAMGPLREVEEVVVWGAGKTSRGHAEYMTEYGVKIAAYIDIDPKKIGQKIRGIPVIAPEQLGEYANHLILPFVANRGARKEIRQALIKMGKVEGKDFICCA
jgi:glycosyltransferase involved in cell wall biosynthesis